MTSALCTKCHSFPFRSQVAPGGLSYGQRLAKDGRTWLLYSITRGPCAASARHMTSGGTTSLIPKCFFRSGAAAGARPRHALGNVLFLDLIFFASCLRRCSAITECLHNGCVYHCTTWPPHLHVASPHLHMAYAPYIYLRTCVLFRSMNDKHSMQSTSKKSASVMTMI